MTLEELKEANKNLFIDNLIEMQLKSILETLEVLQSLVPSLEEVPGKLSK